MHIIERTQVQSLAERILDGQEQFNRNTFQQFVTLLSSELAMDESAPDSFCFECGANRAPPQTDLSKPV